jgi:hypothetical protein
MVFFMASGVVPLSVCVQVSIYDADQLGRRNITPDQFTLLLGRRYNRAKKAQFSRPGNDNAAKREDQNDPRDSATTADKLAVEHGVSPATVKRAGQYAEAVATYWILRRSRVVHASARVQPPLRSSGMCLSITSHNFH